MWPRDYVFRRKKGMWSTLYRKKDFDESYLLKKYLVNIKKTPCFGLELCYQSSSSTSLVWVTYQLDYFCYRAVMSGVSIVLGWFMARR